MNQTHDNLATMKRKYTTLRRARNTCVILAFVCWAASMPVGAIINNRSPGSKVFLPVFIGVFVLGLLFLFVGAAILQSSKNLMNEAIWSRDKSKIAVVLDTYAAYALLYTNDRKDVDGSEARELERIRLGLGRMLASITPDDDYLFSHAQRVTLHKLLAQTDVSLVRTVLHALGAVGNNQDLDAIEQRETESITGVDSLVLEADFKNAKAAIRKRLGVEAESSGLLRGSTEPPTENALLKPAVENDDVHAGELPRTLENQ